MRTLLPLLALVLPAACTPREESRRWRVTVEVETPAGLATGSGVVETRYRPRSETFSTLDSPRRRVLGEAIAVDLPQGVLLALLDGQGDYGFFRSQMGGFGWVRARAATSAASPLHYPSPNTPEERHRLGRPMPTATTASAPSINRALAEHRPFALIEEGWPRFVLLTDPGDPRGAVALAPTETAEAAVGQHPCAPHHRPGDGCPCHPHPRRPSPLAHAGAMPVSGRLTYPPRVPADSLLPADFSTLLE